MRLPWIGFWCGVAASGFVFLITLAAGALKIT